LPKFAKFGAESEFLCDKSIVNIVFEHVVYYRSESAPFGWEIIRDMWKREVARRDNSLSQRVNGLNLADIERDQWTKLSVMPAKKIQQGQVSAKLLDSYRSKQICSILFR
jgi:hypothetical protein